MTARLAAAVGVVCTFALFGASCSATDSDPDAANRSVDVLALPTTEGPTTTTTRPTYDCGDPTASYPALDALPQDDAVVAKIFARGKLLVAVDENTEGLASRNPDSGDLEGLEIDLAREIARAIFGRPDAVQFTTVTTKEKIQYPRDGTVDVSISAISMTCDRWRDVKFSSEYFTARQAFLVRADSKIAAPTDLGGARVCMTQGSTSIGVLDKLNATLPTKAIPLLVDARTDCLVALQEGKADAYLGHDTFLVGMVDQDPNLKIVPEASEQHYGIAVDPNAVALTQYVNGILQRLRADGWLGREYESTLGALYADAKVPLPAVPEGNRTRPLP